MAEPEDLITATEAARILGVTRQRISAIAQTGRLGRRVAGRYWLFTRDEVEAYKEQRQHNVGGRPRKDRPPDDSEGTSATGDMSTATT